MERTQINAPRTKGAEDRDYQDFKYKELTDKIISEIKAVKNVAEEHEAQLSNYLKQLIEKLGYYLIMAPNQTLNAKRFIIQENKYLRVSAKICVLICINKDYRI